uniref:Uncharacterized protein n=1 Tax=Anguilla anguilla TaxID=7936 RepID=A0A0E9SDW6_ANGAN
MDSVQNSPF